MATHSSNLAWRSPWTGASRLRSIRSYRVRHDVAHTRTTLVELFLKHETEKWLILWVPQLAFKLIFSRQKNWDKTEVLKFVGCLRIGGYLSHLLCPWHSEECIAITGVP